MKARIRRYEYLSPSEQKAIKADYDMQYTRMLYTEEASVQEVWIKLALILLHDYFGFREQRLIRFLGDWKTVYRKNGRIDTVEKQKEYLDKEMERIFPHGFPQFFIDELKKWKDEKK